MPDLLIFWPLDRDLDRPAGKRYKSRLLIFEILQRIVVGDFTSIVINTYLYIKYTFQINI